MRIKGVKDGGIIDDKGQTLSPDDYCFMAVPRRVKAKGFFMGFETAFETLAKDRELRGEPRSVLDLLMARMDFENFIAINQSSISEELGIHKVNVSQVLKLLVTKGILIKGPKMGRTTSYRLNLNYAWKGREKNRQDTINRERLLSLVPD